MSAKTAYPSNLTWDEYLALPDITKHAALIDGEVVVNPPNAQHQRIVKRVQRALDDWIEAGVGRGETSQDQPVKVTDRRGYQPDLGWYPEGQCTPLDAPAAFTGDPALVVEVLSPSTRSRDLVMKRADYELVGITEVWFVDPVDRSVIVCRRPDDRAGFVSTELSASDKLSSSLFDGFVLPISEIFGRL